MNERIKELAEQAGMIIGDASNFDMAKFMPKEVKFAELIVAECAYIAARAQDENMGWDISGIIKEHFGVEEQVQDSKELHTCPYREEIHNDYESLCDCDEEQQHQCAMDI